MKKQICSSLLALTMTMGTVAPAMASEVEVNVPSAECTCTTACTEDNRNADCAICGAEGAPLTDCAQVNTNNEQQTANAENGFAYTVTGDEATITGYTGSAKNLVIPSELGGKPVTEIGRFAFAHCDSLTEVTIPEGVTSIGDSAFRNCSSLTKVTIPKSVTSIKAGAFAYCSSLTKVIIPEGVTSIGKGVFGACSSLTEVTIPKSVTSIGPGAFDDCGALATVYYGGTQEDWDALKKNIGEGNTPLLNANIICAIQESNGFEYTVTGDEATITGYTGSAKNIVIPSELGGKPVTAIADKAFYGYGKMRDIYIPKTVKTIGEDAFQNAASTDEADSWIQFICYEGTEKEWANIAIQEGNNAVKPDDAHFRIGVYECSLSGDMVYQASDDAANFVRYFGTDSKVKIPAELGGKPVTEIGEWAFAYYSSLTEVTIPEGVTSIGKGAFSPCSSLTEVTIPKSVTSIGEWAFEGCSNLTKVIISEGVTSIGGGAFRACRSLTEVTIPKSVTSIGNSAFHDCGALATVHYGGTQEDWDALKKNIGDNNTPLLNAPNIIYAIQESDGFEYTVTGDEATITGYTGSAKNIVIPSELGGKKVTAIADKAFYGYEKMRDIYIPKTIKAIGENAFQNADITDYLENRIRFICYEGTATEWEDIRVEKGNGVLEPNDDDKMWFREYECSLSGDMVYQTSDDAATLVRYFGSDSKVKIPAELGGKPITTIGDYAFLLCTSLTEVTIPEGVTSIEKGAFGACSSLTEVMIPKNVTSIGRTAFANCTSLTEVTIPKSVTSIGNYAFDGCEALKTGTVYYGGLQEDWDKIRIGQDNEPLLKATIVCKEKPKICKGGKEVEISNGTHEMRIHGKSYGTFTFAWVNDKAGWSIQNADGKYLSFDNGKLVLRDTAYVWKYDAKFYTTTEEKTSSGWGWWGRPSTKVTNWYLVGDGTDLSISKSDTNADVKLYDAMESTEHSFGKWTPAEDGKHTRTCTICGATETGDCTYENGACTVCGALDPDNASVSVSATVTKRTSGGGGWWWSRPTTTTWEARITATGNGVDIDKVEYSNDGKHYLTGTSFTSDTEITKFYIRVTDSKGNVTKWLYENGTVTQK